MAKKMRKVACEIQPPPKVSDNFYLKRRLRRDEVKGAIVSTVKLGKVHEDFDVEVWETMVFGENTRMDGHRQRYVSEEAVIKGHNDIMELVRTGGRPPKRKFLTGMDSV